MSTVMQPKALPGKSPILSLADNYSKQDTVRRRVLKVLKVRQYMLLFH